MTQPPAISLRGVSKKYQLYESLGHRVYEALHPFKKKYHREFWALRDISLDIPKGSTVGILGVNGSGKSTLLQIICSILQPTSGTVEVHGKVAALIELGAGFNPDLTGRENAEINCAIQGLDAQTVRNRIPEIETFADIGEFFDQPVKTYSSGMFMRVAFATAIGVDPDILIVDEALAVGDARFQQKCFRKFRDFQQQGKTIVLVTHDRKAVPRLCNLGFLFDKGRIVETGDPKLVADRYSRLLALNSSDRISDEILTLESPGAEENNSATGSNSSPLQNFLSAKGREDCCDRNATYNKGEHRYGIGGAIILDYLLACDGDENPTSIISGKELSIYVRIGFDKEIESPILGVTVQAKDGILAFSTNSSWLNVELPSTSAGDVLNYCFRVRMALGVGDWFIGLAIANEDNNILDMRDALIHIYVDQAQRSAGIASLPTELDFI